MRDVNGQTVAVLDYSHKRRTDCEIEDEKLRQACMVRIHDRLVPEIRKAFQFNATRMERYIVACYSSDTADHFRPHRDNTTKGTAHRRFAVSLVLNAESFEGGFLRFPEFGRQLYAPPSGGAVVFSCSLLHEATLVTRGTRFVFLPFLYDDAAAAIRQQNLQYIAASDIDPNDTANSRPRSRTMESIELFVVAFMVFVNAIFAAYEIALASVTVARLQFLSDHRRPGAAAALYMKTEIEKSLAVVQLGITLVGLVAGAAGGASASDDIAPMLQRFGLSAAVANVAAIVLVVLPLTAVTIIGGELVPKLFALRNKEWVCLRLSPMMKMFATSVWPVVWALEAAASGLMDLSEKLWIPKPHADARTESVE